MAVNDINAINFRGKSKATQIASGKPTKEAIKKGMMGGFGAFSQGADFGNTDWGNWGSDWGQQSTPPPVNNDPWGGGNWQGDFNWEFGGGYGTEQTGWGGQWGDDGTSVQGKAGSSQPSKATPEPESEPEPAKPKKGR
jgi:hypothetical protein